MGWYLFYIWWETYYKKPNPIVFSANTLLCHPYAVYHPPYYILPPAKMSVEGFEPLDGQPSRNSSH